MVQDQSFEECVRHDLAGLKKLDPCLVGTLALVGLLVGVCFLGVAIGGLELR